ncbi:transposase-like protein [Klebsiella sp. BIGb0407]|nr:transposase-like protein [Klebsiella sp. BIGb0407]
MEGISEASLYSWRNQAKSEEKSLPGTEKTTDQWSAGVALP